MKEEFETKCKKQVEKEKRWEELRESQKQYGSCHSPNRSFFGSFSCPSCGNELTKEHISDYHYSSEKVIFRCFDCKYEHASTITIAFMPIFVDDKEYQRMKDHGYKAVMWG